MDHPILIGSLIVFGLLGPPIVDFNWGQLLSFVSILSSFFLLDGIAGIVISRSAEDS